MFFKKYSLMRGLLIKKHHATSSGPHNVFLLELKYAFLIFFHGRTVIIHGTFSSDSSHYRGFFSQQGRKRASLLLEYFLPILKIRSLQGITKLFFIILIARQRLVRNLRHQI